MIRNKTKLLDLRVKLFWLGLILIATLLVPAPTGAQTGSTVRIDPATASIDVGDTLNFSIIIDVEAGKNYGKGSYLIEYDDTVLQLNSFDVALFGVKNITTPGKISFNALSADGETGSVILGSGQFTAIGQGDSSVTIGFTDPPGDSSGVELTNTSIVNSIVSIAGPTNTPTNTPVVPTNTPTNTPVVPTNTPTNTPVVPTNTPTNTPVVPTNTPTNTPVVPTNTPTNTPVVPTNTPTNTPVVPTNTPTNSPVVPTNTPTNTPVVPTNPPTNTPVVPTNTPTSTPSPSSCQLLTNGDFESGLTSWDQYGTLILSSNAFEGTAALDVSNGWAGQVVNAKPNTDYTLQGHYQTVGNAAWVGVGIDYLDNNGVEIGEHLVRLSPNVSAYKEFSVSGTSPAGTSQIQVWLFSSYGGKLLVDNVFLKETLCDGPSATPTPKPSTPTPTQTPIPAGCELLSNGGFEHGVSGWSPYGRLNIVSDRFEGQKALKVTNGWAGQVVSAAGPATYTLSGYFKVDRNPGWVGVGMDYLDSNGNELGENLKRFTPGTSVYTPFVVEGTAPAGTEKIRVWLYSSYGGHLLIDDVSLQEAGCGGVAPTPTPSPTETPASSSCGPLMQEAEAGTISGSKFVIGNRSDASGGQYVYVPDKSGNISSTVANNVDYVSYCFDVPADGDYTIQGWVSFEGNRTRSDSFFIQVDDLPGNGYLWDTLKRKVFTQDEVSDRDKQNPVVVNLTAGEHIVKVHLREDGTLLDKIALTPAD